MGKLWVAWPPVRAPPPAPAPPARAPFDRATLRVFEPSCFRGVTGMGPYIAQQAEWRLAEIDGIEDISVDLVFEPPWTPEMITEEGKRLLGLD